MATENKPQDHHVLNAGHGTYGITLQDTTMTVGSTGYVALLDVLGFRSLIGGGSDWIGKYLNAVQSVLAESDVEAVIFSDSVVLTKHGGDAESLHAICKTCAMLMHRLLEMDTPVRGAISHGEFHRSPFGKSVFVAGRPIVEAYDYEIKQDWVGVMLTPSAIRAPHGLDWKSVGHDNFSMPAAHENLTEYMKWKPLVQRYRRIPVHSQLHVRDSLDGYAIVPCPTATLGQISGELRAVMQKLDYLKLNAPTPEDQRKYSGALDWLNELRQRWESLEANYAQYAAQFNP